MTTKTKIVLDADVIIHFIKGDRLGSRIPAVDITKYTPTSLI